MHRRTRQLIAAGLLALALALGYGYRDSLNPWSVLYDQIGSGPGGGGNGGGGGG